MKKALILGILISVMAAYACPAPAAAQLDLATDMLNRINAARLAQGLTPYASNQALVDAAQRHSQDMATTGKVDHVGSDQSSFRERIMEAGYGQWTFGPVVNESLYGGTGGADIAYEWWMSSESYRSQILSPRYREIGVAAVVGENGWMYWTLTFGSQPNVLPAFINEGVNEVDDADVSVSLTNENAVPAGEGMTTMGQALQVRLAHDEQFTAAEWQPWQPRLPFQLLPQEEQRIYVQYRDAQGRTAVVWDSVRLTHIPPTASPTQPPSDTPTPAASPTPLPSDTPLPQPSPTDGQMPTAAPPASGAPATVTVVVLPSPGLPTPGPASLTPAPVVRTARPRPSPRPLATSTAGMVSLNGGIPPPGLAWGWLVLQTLAIGLAILALANSGRKS